MSDLRFGPCPGPPPSRYPANICGINLPTGWSWQSSCWPRPHLRASLERGQRQPRTQVAPRGVRAATALPPSPWTCPGVWGTEAAAGPRSAFPRTRPHGGPGEPGIVLSGTLPLGSLIIVHFIKGKQASKSCGFMGRDLDGSHYCRCPISVLVFCRLCLPFSPGLISCLCFLLPAWVQREWAIVSVAGRVRKPFERASGRGEAAGVEGQGGGSSGRCLGMRADGRGCGEEATGGSLPGQVNTGEPARGRAGTFLLHLP